MSFGGQFQLEKVSFQFVFLNHGVFLLFPLPFNPVINFDIAGCVLSDCRLKATLIFLSFTGKRVSL